MKTKHKGAIDLVLEAVKSGLHFQMEICEYVRARGVNIHSANSYLAGLRIRGLIHSSIEFRNGKSMCSWSVGKTPEFRTEKPEDMPQIVAHWMGYNAHGVPKGGRMVDNSDFRPDYGVSQVRINIPSHMGMLESANGVW